MEPVWIFWEDKNLLLMLNKRPLRYVGENRFSMVLIGHVDIESYKKGCRERRTPPLPLFNEEENELYTYC